MFGRWRRKKEPQGDGGDSGLLYAGPDAAEPEAAGPAGKSGAVSRTFETDRGPLEMRETAMLLATQDGDINIPYHQVDAWDDAGKKFTVWWNSGGPNRRNYTMSCVPKDAPPAAIGRELRETIHRNTFAV